MSGVSAAARASATEIERTVVHPDEQLFSPCLNEIARTLWPNKTAANIAAVAGCSKRAADFCLAGEREWSGDAIAAIVAEILSRHKLRNVRVRPRP